MAKRRDRHSRLLSSLENGGSGFDRNLNSVNGQSNHENFLAVKIVTLCCGALLEPEPSPGVPLEESHLIAPNLQFVMQVRHLVHLSRSIRATVFFSQVIALDGHFL
jgi:hypothetical protein